MTNPSRVPESEYDRLGSEECSPTATAIRRGLGRGSNTSFGVLSQSKPSPCLETMTENSDNHHGSFDPSHTKRGTHTIIHDATATATTIMRARSNTCPAPGMPELTKRYVGRMSSLLGGFQKAVESSQSHPPRGYGAGATAVADDQTEVDAVPEFFCDGARSTSGSRFDSRGDSPDLEADLMDPEFIANLVTVQDLDIVMEDCFPSSPPDPREETPPRVVQERGGDFATVAESSKQQASEEREARNIQGSCQEASGVLGTNGDMLSLQKEKHPKSDSGVGSTLGSPGKGFSSKEYEGYEYQGGGNLLFGESRPHESSHADPLGSYSGDEYGATGNGSPDSQHSARFPGGGRPGYHEFMPHSAQGSFEVITPPDSAAPISPLEFLFDTQKRNELEYSSIEVMIKFILDPLAANPAFECFQGLCNQAKEYLFRGKICWLRDLEKFLLLGPDVHLSSSYKSFCEAFIQGCKKAVARIREQDQRRSYDPDYTEAYFIDTLHHLKQKADMSVQSLDTEASADIDTTKNRMNRPANPHSVSLRSVASPREVSSQKYIVPQTAVVKAHPRQLHHSFRQPLAIQTQHFTGRYSNHPELGSLSPRDSADDELPMNPMFNFERAARAGNAEVHLHEIDEYHAGGAREAPSATGIPLSSTATGGYSRAMTGQLAGYTLPPTPASAQSSPVAPPYVGLSNATIVGGAAPAQGASSGGRNASVFSCNLCSKEFPRACDLTKHRKTHERPFKCDVVTCKYHTLGFPTGKERERHENDIHSSNSKKWNCHFPPCTYRSKRESNCKQHMEKTHGYDYIRMKRNPRKKTPLAPVAVAGVNKKCSGNGKPAASPSALKVVKALEQQQESEPRGAAASSSQGTPTTSDGFAGYHGYPQQTGVHNFGFIQPSHTPQMVNLREPPLFDGSPTTDFEPSPAPCAPGYGNPPNAYHSGSSTIDHPDWLPEPQSRREFLESFLSDFPQGDSHFAGIQQQMQEHPLPNSHQFGSPNPQFDEGMDCEWKGNSPD